MNIKIPASRIPSGFAMALALISSQIAYAQLEPGQPKHVSGVRETIQRSIPFIQKEGQAWIRQKKCITCHQVPFMVWSLNSADRHGFELDRDVFTESREWSTNWINLTKPKNREKADERTTLLKENDSIAELLLGLPGSSDGENKQEWIATYLSHLKESQLKDGSWMPKGQLPEQKRPFRETREVATMWALLAIESCQDNSKRDTEYQTSAISWLGDETIGKSTEWWATRLMLERTLGNDKRAMEVKAQLVNLQHADGSWGWLSDEPGDAFATGIAVYALSRDGMDPGSRPIADATGFLTTSQNKDGSWSVNGTKEGARNRSTPTASYWGTCWAVIGLLETLPDPDRPDAEP